MKLWFSGKEKRHTALIESWPAMAEAIAYAELDAEQQAQAREEFFQIAIQPKVSKAALALARLKFEREVTNMATAKTTDDSSAPHYREKAVAGQPG